MVTVTGSLGASVKPLNGALKMAKMGKKSGGKKAPKAAKQPSGAGAGVAANQSKINRFDSFKMPGKK